MDIQFAWINSKHHTFKHHTCSNLVQLTFDMCIGSGSKHANFMKRHIPSSRVPVTWPTIAWEILRLLRKVLISSFTRLLSRLYKNSRGQRIRIFRGISQWFKTQGLCSDPPAQPSHSTRFSFSSYPLTLDLN